MQGRVVASRSADGACAAQGDSGPVQGVLCALLCGAVLAAQHGCGALQGRRTGARKQGGVQKRTRMFAWQADAHRMCRAARERAHRREASRGRSVELPTRGLVCAKGCVVLHAWQTIAAALLHATPVRGVSQQIGTLLP